MPYRKSSYTASLVYPNQFGSPAPNNLPHKKTHPLGALLLNWAEGYLIGE